MDGYGKRVLVVDDDMSAGLLMCELLQHEGYNVVAVSNGLHALCELSKRHFDVVVTDYVMPLLNGLELLKQINALYSDTPVILVSANLPEQAAAQIDSQPFACIRKPYWNETLLELVRSAVQAPAKTKRDTMPAVAMP
jgi:CheY-like chemotaxis protein